MFFNNRILTALAIATAIALIPALTTNANATTLNGAGATLPIPLYERYAREVKKQYPDLQINYQGIGSTGGVRQMLARTVDFAGSDFAMNDADIAKVARGIIMVPTGGSAISIVYNLPGVTNLKLSRVTLPAIFSGQITNWSDARIKADNPGVNLPNQPIRYIVRADPSGSSFIFTNHLSGISPFFKGRIGASDAPSWPLANILKGKGNAGVAALVARTPGAIGYVNFTTATMNNLKSALIQNKTGAYITPSLQSATQALSTTSFPSNFRVFVNDPTQGYPIVGFTWILIYKTYPTPAQVDAVKKWATWVLVNGQQFNAQLNYTRIPTNLVNSVVQAVNAVHIQ